ncbi:MAG: creatininase family protein [Rhodospirillaceae bacterium]
MRLQLATWPEVESYLAKSTGIIIPLGSTEQHGPTGFIGTDALCPEILAYGLDEKRAAEGNDVMIAPTLSIGMAQHHLGFAGSVTLRPTTLIAVVQDVVNSLAKHGFDRFYFLNGHGGNIATVSAAFSEIYAEHSFGRAGDNRPPVRCQLVNWFTLPGVMEICKDAFGDDDGSHATCGEVSLTYYGFQKDAERVRHAAMAPGRAGEGKIYDSDDYRRRFPDGRIGSDPRKASVDVGEKLFNTAIGEIAESYDTFVGAA